MPARSDLLFPVETINRELDFRLWLACLHARPHRRIFLGQHDLLYDLGLRMRNGIYLGKNIFKHGLRDVSQRRYQALKERGFTVLHLDEEGGIYVGDEENWRRTLDNRLDPRILQADDYVCTWGNFQRDHFRSYEPPCRDHIRTTGHPRFDLYKAAYRRYYDADVSRLRERFGDFVLVNTNFTIANFKMGHGAFFARGFQGYDPGDTARRLEHIRRWSHIRCISAYFVTAVNRLSVEFPGVNLVIRPHPSEDCAFYEQIFQGVPNIHVVHEGAVSPWLLACRVLLQDGCTTSIEAHFAETPTIQYKALADAEHDYKVPGTFGLKCVTEAEVVEAVGSVLSGGEPFRAPVSEPALAVIENFRRDAFPSLSAVLDEAEEGLAGDSEGPTTAALQREEAQRGLMLRARSAGRRFFPQKRRAYAYAQQKFYGLEPEKIARKLEIIGSLTGKRVSHTFYSDSLISIQGGE